MQSISYLPASNGAANVSLMTVQNIRAANATSIITNTVSGAPQSFYATMGTPHTFTDPVTGEVITVISEATAVDFAGHLLSGHVEIDTIAPGYTDLGSKVGDIVIIRPVTEWANNLANILNQSLNDNGSIKNSAITYNPNIFDHVASGAVLAGLGYGSTLTASLSAGVCYINGNIQTIAAVATRTYTASKDTYVDALYSSTGTATIVYTEVANNAASPALAANSIRLGIVVTGVNIAAVGSINQGEESKVLPIASSIPYQVTDSLGNLICPRDSTRKIFGLRRRLSTFSTASTSFVPVTECTVPFIVPGNEPRKVKFIIDSSAIQANAQGAVWTIGLLLDGTIIQQWYRNQDVSALNMPLDLSFTKTIAAGSHTVGLSIGCAGATVTLSGGADNPGTTLNTPGPIGLSVESR